MKPGARYIVIEMARRLTSVSEPIQSKRKFAENRGLNKDRLVETALVLDHSIDGDLRGFRWKSSFTVTGRYRETRLQLLAQFWQWRW